MTFVISPICFLGKNVHFVFRKHTFLTHKQSTTFLDLPDGSLHLCPHIQGALTPRPRITPTVLRLL